MTRSGMISRESGRPAPPTTSEREEKASTAAIRRMGFVQRRPVAATNGREGVVVVWRLGFGTPEPPSRESDARGSSAPSTENKTNVNTAARSRLSSLRKTTYLVLLPEAFKVGKLYRQPDLELLGKGARVRRLPLLDIEPVSYNLAPRQLQRSTWSGRGRRPGHHGVRLHPGI